MDYPHSYQVQFLSGQKTTSLAYELNRTTPSFPGPPYRILFKLGTDFVASKFEFFFPQSFFECKMHYIRENIHRFLVLLRVNSFLQENKNSPSQIFVGDSYFGSWNSQGMVGIPERTGILAPYAWSTTSSCCSIADRIITIKRSHQHLATFKSLKSCPKRVITCSQVSNLLARSSQTFVLFFFFFF